MSSKIRTIGLKSIKLGDPAADGGMGEVLAPWGLTYKKTCKFETGDPTVVKHRAEEVSGVVASIAEEGDTTIKFQIMNADADALQKALGGEVSGTGTALDPKKWEAPDVMPVIEQSIEMTPKVGGIIEIPRASITAKINFEASNDGIFLIDVTAEVLIPEKAGVSKITFIEPASA